MRALVFVLIAEFWIICGQICFKKSADRLENPGHEPWISHLLKAVLRQPMLWMGGASMLAGMLFWFAALSTGQLSTIYPLGSAQYIFALAGAHYFLHEKVDTHKLVGTLLITLGIILTALN